MTVLGSEWGGLAVAAIVLLLILITYWYAVNGRKMALIFYVLGGIIFFVCNLNYFYPSYLSRKLVREEATLLNDTLQVYTNKGKRLLSTVLKNSVIEEIRKNGQGPRSRKYFADFNKICEKHKIPVIILSDDAKMTDVEFANYYLGLFTGRMRQFLENKTEAGGDLGDAQNFVLATEMYVAIQKKYTPILIDSIIPDNSEIKIENIKSNPQVITLQKLASELDEASSQINESLKNKKGDKTLPNFSLIGETKSQNIGTIAHTVASIKDRITKVDTWAIIILCLFVDLIVPLAIYLLLRKKGDEEEESGPVYTGPEKF
jgi:hypothetical protein